MIRNCREERTSKRIRGREQRLVQIGLMEDGGFNFRNFKISEPLNVGSVADLIHVPNSRSFQVDNEGTLGLVFSLL